MFDEFHHIFPLAWPKGVARTDPAARLPSPVDALSIETATDAVIQEFKLLGLDYLWISMNESPGGGPVRRPPADDPGVSIIFKNNDKPVSLHCDRYSRSADNMAACAALLRRERGALSLPYDRGGNIQAATGRGMFAGIALGEFAMAELMLAAGLTLGLVPDTALDQYYGAQKSITRWPGS